MATSTTQDVTTATMYQLHRGNHRTDPDGMAAEDLRREVRDAGYGEEFDEVDFRAIGAAEFDRLWDEVGAENFPGGEFEEHGEILTQLSRRWNTGSGFESKAFKRAKTRSLEVGDIAEVEGTYYLVMPMGWCEITISDDETTA